MTPQIAIHEDVRSALEAQRPVVALETAVLTHGLPARPLGSTPRLLGEASDAARRARADYWGADESPHCFREDHPLNLEVAHLVESTVRACGGVPATIAVLDGILRIGLSPSELEDLAGREHVHKCSTRELAPVMAAGFSAGTTVAGTLAAIRAANQQLCQQGLPTIEVFATGGIGGVHRNWSVHRDISADIQALATTRTVVVSAGAKAILDLPATREALESRMVPVLGWRTSRFPMFTAPGLANQRPIPRVDEEAEVARICRTHWQTLAREEGVLLVNEIPAELGLDPEELEREVAMAVLHAEEQGIAGAELTPFLLEDLAARTEGAALDANITLLCSNAALATRMARALAG